MQGNDIVQAMQGHVLARHVQRVSRNIHCGDIGVGEGVGREDREAT